MFTILCIEHSYHFAFQICMFLRQLRARSNHDTLHNDMYLRYHGMVENLHIAHTTSVKKIKAKY